MEPIALKKSCDACTASKVKCSGGHPCERCSGKGIECYYSPRKRRAKKNGKPKNLLVMENDIYGMSVLNDYSDSSLMEWERRSWSVFFTLYKHYGTGCTLYWFNRQLHKMKTYLKRAGNLGSLKRLTAWMNALNIDEDYLVSQIQSCNLKIDALHRRLSLKVSGTVEDMLDERLSSSLEETSPRVPFIKVNMYHPNGMLSDEGYSVSVRTNSAFESVFGLTSRQLENQLNLTGGGFLPWGGDVLARLLTKEKDILSFVQIVAIKFNALGKPEKLPILRDIPSCHMFEVNMRAEMDSDEMRPANALIKCMHREHGKVDSAVLEMSLEFTPMAPFHHLLPKTMEGVPRTLDEPLDYKATQLKGGRNIIPFASRKRSRYTNYDPLESSTDKIMESKINPLNQDINGYNDHVPDFDELMKSKAGFVLPSPGLSTTSSGKSDFSGGESYPRESYNHEEEKQIGYLDEDEISEKEQTEWLDSLLDWANQQELPQM